MGHSRFAPSAEERNTACPPSFLLNEQMPDKSSPDADHGTAAHHLGELCLRTDKNPDLYAGCVIAVSFEGEDRGECRFVHENAPPQPNERTFEVDDEMIAAVQTYVDWCRELPGDHYVEVRVEHTRWCPDVDEWGEKLGPQYGTSDEVCIEPKIKTITVTDLKYGKGVQVFAEKNKQAIKYALGVVNEYAWEYGIDDSWTVRIRICQPRLNHLDVWETTVGELMRLGEEQKARLTLVFDPDAEFNPGEKQCKFCKVRARCKALRDATVGLVATGFEDETEKTFSSPHLLEPEELVEAYLAHPLYKLRFEAIEAEILSSLKGGFGMPGLKLVNAMTHRRWKDESLAKAKLLSLGVSSRAIVKEKMISPNQAEKLLQVNQRSELEPLWDKPAGGPVIALESDKRDAYTAHAPSLEGFDDETEDDDGF